MPRWPFQSGSEAEKTLRARRAAFGQVGASPVFLRNPVPQIGRLFGFTPEFGLRPFEQSFDIFSVRPEDQDTQAQKQ